MSEDVHNPSGSVSIPFHHSVAVMNLPVDGMQITIAATELQRREIARFLQLPSIEQLEASFNIRPGKAGHVHVHGKLKSSFYQTCVVTFDDFPTTIEAPVDLEFAPQVPAIEASSTKPAKQSRQKSRAETLDNLAAESPDIEWTGSHFADEIDPPDPIIDGQIDLGALTVEFLALSLDPFPRKPGAEFRFQDMDDAKPNPFAALAAFKPKSG